MNTPLPAPRGLLIGLRNALAVTALITAVVLALTGCGSSGDALAGSTTASTGQPGDALAGSTTASTGQPGDGTTPNPTGPAGPATNCNPSCDPVAPQADSSEPAYTGPVTLPACQAGTTPSLAAASCACPPADVGAGGICVIPVPPPACPAPGALVNGVCQQPPAMSLRYEPAGTSAYSLIWTSTGAQFCTGAAGFPINGTLPPSGQVNALDVTATTSYTLVCSNAAGNALATASIVITVAPAPPPVPPPANPPATPPPVCAVPDVLIGALCEAPPVLSLALSISPTVVSDDRAGCPAPDGSECTATVSLNAASNLPGTISCQDPGGNAITTPAWASGDYGSLQDGPHVLTFECWQYGIPVSQSITLTVVAPGAPPAPQFSCALNGNTLACTWDVFGTQGCEVHLFDNPGVEWILSPGGTASGSAVSGFLSPAYDPWTATLYCGGVPAPGVSTITVAP